MGKGKGKGRVYEDVLGISSNEEGLIEGKSGDKSLSLDFRARRSLQIEYYKGITLCPHYDTIQLLVLK